MDTGLRWETQQFTKSHPPVHRIPNSERQRCAHSERTMFFVSDMTSRRVSCELCSLDLSDSLDDETLVPYIQFSLWQSRVVYLDDHLSVLLGSTTDYDTCRLLPPPKISLAQYELMNQNLDCRMSTR